jgi:hypothetical protein
MGKLSGFAFGLMLASGGIAGAQVPKVQVQTPEAGTPASAPTEVRRMSQLLGSTVQLQGTNEFGRVEDAVIDENGSIAYLVVNSENRNYMLPWSEANYNFGRRIVSYGVAPQAIQPLAFEASAWPNVWAPQYMTRVRGIFPNWRMQHREVLRPVVPPGTGNPAAPPPGTRIEEQTKVKPNGDVTVKAKVR